MWSYINCNWDAQPMWRGEDWGDTRAEAHAELIAIWPPVKDVPRLFATAKPPRLGRFPYAPDVAPLFWTVTFASILFAALRTWRARRARVRPPQPIPQEDPFV